MTAVGSGIGEKSTPLYAKHDDQRWSESTFSNETRADCCRQIDHLRHSFAMTFLHNNTCSLGSYYSILSKDYRIVQAHVLPGLDMLLNGWSLS